jgi:multidrug efflux pump
MNDQRETKQKVVRQFPLTNLSLRNKTSVYLLVVILLVFGVYSFRTMPKELFPDIVIPTIYVQTIYPGNPPVDVENLITRPIENELDVLKGVKEIRSTSSQDISSIFVEFHTNVDIKKALQDVKDAVDKAKSDLPNDLQKDPTVMDIDLSQFPIIYVNLSGDFSINELKTYADNLKDEFETIQEISKVEIKGLNDREIQINVDPHKLESMMLTFYDIENAIGYENISMSGGQVLLGETRRSIRVIGEFKKVDEIKDIVIKHENGKIVKISDVADVVDAFAEPKDFARLNNEPVVSLQVVKKGGENLLAATDQIFAMLDKDKKDGSLPPSLKITITNDQSDLIRRQLNELENSMILGVILVVFVLYFFLGTRNSLIVGLAIPLSMFISFVIFSLMGFKLNMIVLFSLILALGRLVDDAIVAVENTYRFVERGYTKMEAARSAVGEIAGPIIASTATTLSAFVPLLFWKSIIGEFMRYLPLTLIITLGSSLFVAVVISPVLTSTFMKSGDQFHMPKRKNSLLIISGMILVAALFYLAGWNTPGSLLVLFAFVGICNILFLNRLGRWFSTVFLTWLDNLYRKVLKYVLVKRHPYYFVAGSVALLFFTIFLMGVRAPKVEFWPSVDPRYINILATLPVGTDIGYTNTFMKKLEGDVNQILDPYKPIVKSVLTTVGNGARGENEGFAASETPNRGLTTVTFVDHELRGGVHTTEILKKLSDNLIGRYPGVLLSVEQPRSGPPTGKQINLEIAGKEFDKLLFLADTIENYINSAKIDGIEGLKLDLDVGKPEMLVHIDRENARRFGLSTIQIAGAIRTALFGKDISDFKEGEDKYPIELRLKEEFRYNPTILLDQKIAFRDPATGRMNQVPISAVASITYSTTYDAVKRKDLKRVVTVYSNVIKGYNATDINNQLKVMMAGFNMPAGYNYSFTGEQQEQAESMKFLSNALLIALALIMLILVTQFNSIVKPSIIMASVLFSTIGVFGGIATFKMDFIVIMTGIGIIALAGIVVSNAIVLLDYMDLVKLRKKRELGLDDSAKLPRDIEIACLIEGGKTRLRPVLLTAITTLLGLLPLAIGMNIDFISLFEKFNPKIYFGGDNVAFWGPMSWTIIFGLTLSTFLTLLIVPALYHILWRSEMRLITLKKKIS